LKISDLFARTLLIASLGLALITQVFCQSSRPDRFIKVYLPGGKEITAELAVTPVERARGLMFREKLEADQGMLFVFEEEDLYSFWMKNTLIPLDIIWLDSHQQIVHIEKNVPPCPREPCPSYTPRQPALYVLELKAGEAEANNLQLYQRVSFILPEWVKKKIGRSG